MFKPRNFFDLMCALKTGTEVDIDGHVGVISSIEREDGSGHKWNVRLRLTVGGQFFNVFFRE